MSSVDLGGHLFKYDEGYGARNTNIWMTVEGLATIPIACVKFAFFDLRVFQL